MGGECYKTIVDVFFFVVLVDYHYRFVFFMYRELLFSSYPRSDIVITLYPLSYRYFISASNRFNVVSTGLLLSLKQDN